MTTPAELPVNFDRYITALFAQEDLALRTARETAAREGLPEIHVSASEGQLLHVLARLIRARRILEVGTLGGYSTIWLARALPEGGRLISLELDPHHASVSQGNIEGAGLAHAVEIRTGPAEASMRAMVAAGEPAFDLVFIDADKTGYDAYFEAILPKLADGGVILIDNVLWGGRVVTGADDADTQALLALNDKLARDERVIAVMLPIRDGITVVRRS